MYTKCAGAAGYGFVHLHMDRGSIIIDIISHVQLLEYSGEKICANIQVGTVSIDLFVGDKFWCQSPDSSLNENVDLF